MLTISNLTIRCEDRVILDNFSLQVKAGEVVGIVGASGCGKTTLLKSIIGILPPRFSVQGKIDYQGTDLTTLSNTARRQLCGRELGFIFQHAEQSFSPVRTLGSQLQELLRCHQPMTPEQSHARIAETFEKIGLCEVDRILKSYPFELSGGMNQRVGIAMALLLKPKLLMADEPTSALDVTAKRQVLTQMNTLCKESGTAILLVSHSKSAIDFLADRVICLSDET